MKTLKSEDYYVKVLFAIFFIYSLVYYIPFFTEGMVVRGDDFNWEWFGFNNPTVHLISKWHLFSFIGGETSPGSLRLLSVLTSIIPKFLATNMFMLIVFSILFFATYLFFRAWEVNRILSILIAILITFSPNFHSFIRTGHVTKMFLSGFLMFAFAFITFYFKTDKHPKTYGLLIAIALTFSFSDGDPQVFLYFLPFFSGYVLWLMFAKHKDISEEKIFNLQNEHSASLEKPSLFLRLKNGFEANRKKNLQVPLIALLTVFLSIPPMYFWYNRYVKEDMSNNEIVELIPTAAQTQGSEEQNINPQQADLQNWYWATQWSLPPLETLTFFVPSFFGVSSQSPEEPYWGRVGQTEGWEQHRQGYQNYSLMDNYLGVFMVLFTIYGFFFLPTYFRIVMGFLLLLFLLLSYGKYAFLYEWFYQLPLVSSFRNPNRFIQLIHFVVAIVFGFGLYHFYLSMKSQILNVTNQLDSTTFRPYRFFKYLTIVFLVIGLIGFVGLFTEKNALIAYFNDRFDYQNAVKIYNNMLFHWSKSVIFYGIALVLLLFFMIKVNSKNLVIWISVLLGFALLDMYLVNKKYYWFEKPVKEKKVETNFEKLFNGKLPGYEMYMVDKDEYFKKRIHYFRPNGQFNTQYGRYIEHYAAIPLEGFHQGGLVRRSGPSDMTAYFSYLRNRDLRFLKLGAVNYFVSDVFISDPSLNLIFRDEVKHLNESLYVYEIKNTLTYLDLKQTVEIGEGIDGILGGMNQSNFDIYDSVMLNKKLLDFDMISQEQIDAIAADSSNSFILKAVSSSAIEIETELESPTILVYNTKYNQNMKAYSDGKELPHFPANYFFNGYYITPEDKHVTISFEKNYSPAIIYASFSIVYLLLFWAVYNFLKQNSRKPKSRKHRAS